MQIENYLKAGSIAGEVRENVRRKNWIGFTLEDICEYVESEIIKRGAKCAFPVNTSLNEIAAHYTAEPNDPKTVSDTDLIKIDLGAQINGYIADTAVTVNYDMGNSAFWEFEAKQEFLCYGEMISNVHIKDCTPKDYTVQLGDGNVNFNEIFLLLKKNNYKSDFILQGARGKDDFLVAKKQFQFAKKYVEKYLL